MHTYTYTHACTHTHTHTHTHTPTCVSVCVCVCVCVYVAFTVCSYLCDAHTCAHKHTHTHCLALFLVPPSTLFSFPLYLSLLLPPLPPPSPPCPSPASCFSSLSLSTPPPHPTYPKRAHIRSLAHTGKCDEESVKLVKCAYDCLKAACDMIKPGTMYRDLGSSIAQVCVSVCVCACL